jgi:hypothetical protein
MRIQIESATLLSVNHSTQTANGRLQVFKLSKAMFPACASFGPIMIAMGQGLPIRDGIPYGFILSVPGAFATVAALMILFRELNSINEKLTAAASKNTDLPQND